MGLYVQSHPIAIALKGAKAFNMHSGNFRQSYKDNDGRRILGEFPRIQGISIEQEMLIPPYLCFDNFCNNRSVGLPVRRYEWRKYSGYRCDQLPDFSLVSCRKRCVLGLSREGQIILVCQKVCSLFVELALSILLIFVNLYGHNPY